MGEQTGIYVHTTHTHTTHTHTHTTHTHTHPTHTHTLRWAEPAALPGLFNENLYVGQLNVSRSIILYLSSPEEREMERERRREREIERERDGEREMEGGGNHSGWMAG